MQLVKTDLPDLATMSLDELFEMAKELGDLKTGGILGNHAAALHCKFTKPDFVDLKCKTYETLKENIADVITRAAQLKAFYRMMK